MRADAEANRAALIEAARDLFAAQGLGVPLSAIAERAGVGIATLYRGFPTREDLILAVATDVRDRLRAVAAEHRPLLEADPETAWEPFVRAVVALRPGALGPAMAASDFSVSRQGVALRREMLAAVRPLFELAQRAGLVRHDLTAERFQIGLTLITRPLPAGRLADLGGEGLADWLVQTYLRGVRY